MNKRKTYQENGMVKKIRLCFVPGIVFLALSLMTGSVLGGGMALSGIGAKAISMGGAFRGLADDWSAAYWNPAGLAQLENSELGVSLSMLSPRPEVVTNIKYSGYDVGYKNGVTHYTNDKNYLVPNLAGFFQVPAPADIKAGVAVFVPYALGSEWDLFNPIYNDIVEEYPFYDHKAELRVVDIHPSFAKSFMEKKLMAGFGISCMRGTIDFRKAYLSATPFPRPHDNIAIDAQMHGEGWGYGANFGVIYKLSDKLQIGISGKTPTTIKFDKGDLKYAMYGIDNPDLKEELLSHATSHAESVSIGFVFPDNGKATNWERDAHGELKLPGDVGIGVAYDFNPKLKLTCDLTYTFWKRLDSIVIKVDGTQSPIDPRPASDLVIRNLYDNIFRFSIGGQYKASEPLTLRAGFYYDPSPIPDAYFTPLITDVGTKYSGNMGISYKLRGGWEAAYTLEYVYFAERDVTDHTLTETSTGVSSDNYPGKYKEHFVANFFSFIYSF
jgi:long-chain fatty acid transport protein